jgi:DNA-binding transcriptional LysR family regulator
MLNLLELEYLVTFADLGTLSKTAEKLNISQPSVTRSMRHIEDAFGVSLFIRSKNHIALNENGQKAVDYARRLLQDARQAVQNVQDFDRSQHTITVCSCAPAPLWHLLPVLSETFSSMTITSSIASSASVMDDLTTNRCQIAITTQRICDEDYTCIPFLSENLFVCVPQSHELAHSPSFAFSDLNGHNFLLLSKLGFWDDLCRSKMPASKFLVQPDKFELYELIKNSSLPCFTTNLTDDMKEILQGRVEIPITDQEANVTYYAVFQHTHSSTLSNVVRSISSL